ncbi:hypothetical protein KM176_04585 [Pseudooceanicola sp. CBS1P-1]|uniref:Uncharacterized protein n=1 Tax=Pseudooceanicola albus TaxID=2692189 RepID=A0A6L7G4M1_9RHOB|nr:MULTISPECIES: hypothetical protein [Pseudooceanicola]MBT9383126.1 hypothetical protein [Pseudooceanicola endophyticus]MXN19314.1 hypothetical protein [Pseudooceanicola albus]
MPVGAVSAGTTLSDPTGNMPPVTAPTRTETVALQPLPVPERRPQASPRSATAREDSTPVPIEQALVEADRANNGSPSGMDRMSLFRGLVAEAEANGANIPGGSSRLYVMVQRLFSMVQSQGRAA